MDNDLIAPHLPMNHPQNVERRLRDEIERLRAEVEGLREQHGRDSAELRRLCAARDEQRDGRQSALERAVVAERERDALRARAERGEARISDAPVASVSMVASNEISGHDDATIMGSYLHGEGANLHDMIGKRVALVVVND